MSIQLCVAPETLPGERIHLLTTPSWSQVGWAARPNDRRGASLWFDGLAATGVNWQANPVSRVSIGQDRATLEARLSTANTRHLLIGNAHFLNQPVRTELFAFADQLGANLTLIYEDGMGTTDKCSGIVDQAVTHGWEHVLFHDLPGVFADTRVTFDGEEYAYLSPTSASADVNYNTYPAIVPTIGFGHFRNWCRQLLTTEEFAIVDADYTTTYRAARDLPAPLAPATLADFAVTALRVPCRSKAIVRLRAIQAALFKHHRCIWVMDLSTLHGWLNTPDRAAGTVRDDERLFQLDNAEMAAIAILSRHDMNPKDMPGARATDDGTLTWANTTVSLTDTQHRLLQVSTALNGRPVISGQRVIRKTQRFLVEQFGYPITVARGTEGKAKSAFAAERLNLRPLHGKGSKESS